MTHYICTGGCGGVSDRPGVCDIEDCSKNGQELMPCGCEDGNHKDLISGENQEGQEEENSD